jgi:hypothetical protein
VRDEGAAAQLGVLYDFFTLLPFWRMQPFADVTGDAVALADPGHVYVVYLPHGGATTIDLSPAERALSARWFNPRTGEYTQTLHLTKARHDFSAPDRNDWALLVQDSIP